MTSVMMEVAQSPTHTLYSSVAHKSWTRERRKDTEEMPNVASRSERYKDEMMKM